MKRIASIQDISCLGRCSLTVALPVISGHISAFFTRGISRDDTMK